MIKKIGYKELPKVKNQLLRKDIEHYLNMYKDFLIEVQASGIDIAGSYFVDHINSLLMEKLEHKGVRSRNDGKSYSYGNISPSCIDCAKGDSSSTFIISLKCNRNCYFCTNKNQFNYDSEKNSLNDIKAEFDKVFKHKKDVASVGITGGEPLLFVNECIDFIEYVKSLNIHTNTRIYTNGDLATKETLMRLADAGLDEIRFGLKKEKGCDIPKDIITNLKHAVKYIPRTMVEMPVRPGEAKDLVPLMGTLNDIGVYSVNLLEFLYPWLNAAEYKKNGYKIKNRPYRILYDYHYAGGLPVADSEKECLILLKHAADNKFRMGVHYCSLENKLTSQVWQQNSPIKRTPLEHLSKKDFFLKTAKAYGSDAELVRDILNAKNCKHYTMFDDRKILEFPVTDIRHLKDRDIELGISSMICDKTDGKYVIREVAVDYTTSRLFNNNDL